MHVFLAYYPVLSVQAFGGGFPARHIRCSAFRLWSASLASPDHSPTMPSADSCRPFSTGSPVLSPALAGPARQVSRGKLRNCQHVNAGFIKHIPCSRIARLRGCWTSRSRARSSGMYHTSYPVPVRRPVPLRWASFRRSLTVPPLPFR